MRDLQTKLIRNGPGREHYKSYPAAYMARLLDHISDDSVINGATVNGAKVTNDTSIFMKMLVSFITFASEKNAGVLCH